MKRNARYLAEVLEWDVSEVCTWLDNIGLGRHATSFTAAKIDGKFLMEGELNAQDLDQLGVVACLDVKRFFFELKELTTILKLLSDSVTSSEIKSECASIQCQSNLFQSAHSEGESELLSTSEQTDHSDAPIPPTESPRSSSYETARCSGTLSLVDLMSDTHTIVVESDDEGDASEDGGDIGDEGGGDCADYDVDSPDESLDSSAVLAQQNTVLESKLLLPADTASTLPSSTLSLLLLQVEVDDGNDNINDDDLSVHSECGSEDSTFTVTPKKNHVVTPSRPQVVLRRSIVEEDLGWYTLKGGLGDRVYMVARKPNGEKYKSFTEVKKSGCELGLHYFFCEADWFKHAIFLFGKEKNYVKYTKLIAVKEE